jgi:hypothetical protein
MEDVLSIVRQLVESLEDPPEIPTEVAIQDTQEIEQAANSPTQSQSYVEPASPLLPMPSPAPQTEVKLPSPAPPPEPSPERTPPQPIKMVEEDRGQTYEVKPISGSMPTPERPKDVAVLDPQRVAAAAATAEVNRQFATKSPEIQTQETFDVRQVTPNTRVEHYIPEAFPIDAGHAFAVIDRDVQLPELFPDNPEFPELGPPVEVVSTEKMVADRYAANDSLEETATRRVL